jgi:hypothetical protein
MLAPLPKDPAKIAAELRAGAIRVRGAAEALNGRAEKLPRSMQRRLLRLQAGILKEGADTLDDRALEIEPAKGSA